jgi:hypothetical protein
MAKKFEGRQDEVEMLKGIDGIDLDSITQQITGEPTPVTPPAGTPPVTDTPPATPPVAGTPPATTPKPGEAGPPPDATGILKEIFGDQFTSVDDLKKKNIPEVLKEIATLRQQNQTLSAEKEELSGKLNIKPKNNFANDDVALFNEFVKTTGNRSFDVFQRLNGKDVANMDDMDAIVLTRMLDNPGLSAKEPQLRKHVEKTYNVDPEQVSEEELEINKIGLAEDGYKAKLKLQELKGKLKIPEPDQSAPPTTPVWTPEQENQAKAIWTAANKAMGEKLSKIPIFMPNNKEPFINFAIPEETQKAIETNALDFAVSNHMEANEENLTSVAKFMYSELIMRNLDHIAHSIFEKARSMTQEESLKFYHNPTPLGNGDQPPAGRGEPDDEETQKKKLFEAEMGRQ